MPSPRNSLLIDMEVVSLEGRPLLPAGTVVDAAALEAVAAAGRTRAWRHASLLGHGSVRQDIARGAGQGNYATVFGDGEAYEDLERLMGTVALPEPCLRGLDWFRDNDFYTYRHVLMVFALSCLLAQRLGRNGAAAAAEVMAGPLHDFGKLCVPLAVLRKTSALTRGERVLLEQHTLAGHVLLAHYFDGPASLTTRVARDHHERRDGSGYPSGAALADPLVEIVAVCDIYDALVSPRPYRAASFDTRSALEEITALAERGTFGWDVVKLLVAQNRRDKPSPERVEVSLQKRGHQPEGNLYGIYADEPQGR
jgi:HD-GYP domain-containing protein (c-di-GMP phosphodiesterase class II)